MTKRSGLASALSLTESLAAQKSNGLKMTNSTLDILRKEAFLTRVKGIPGANKILWSTKQQADFQDLIMSSPEEAFRAPQHKFVDSTPDLASVRGKLMASSMLAAGDGQPSGNAPWI